MKHLLFALISSPILAFAGNYTTNFASPPAPENPISENRMWINGADTGILWSNCRTSSNFAYGTQPGNLTGDAMYADSIAVLAGTWGPNQSATATIKLVSAPNAASVFAETEIRLCSTIAPNWSTGYEFNTSVSANGNYLYCEIGRWDGPRYDGIHSAFLDQESNGGSVHNGSVMKAVISGPDLYLYIDGVKRCHAIDTTYRNGSPGIGFYLQGTTGINANYGFSNFTATDGTGVVGSPPPANLGIVP